MLQSVLTRGWLVVALCWITPFKAQAQLAPATWVETIVLSYGNTTKQWNGTNIALPETHVEELQGTGYDVLGSLTYGPPGPPQIIAHQEGNGHSLKGTTQGTLWFEFEVLETSAPPTPVSDVPITISVIASAQATRQTCVYFDVCNHIVGSVVFVVGQNGMKLMKESMYSGGGVKHDFDISKMVLAQVGQPFNASITCQAYVDETSVLPSTLLTATASAYSTVTVSSDLIPGTDSKYSDFFHIEYSPGYWALGNPTPVRATTWGKIKSLYSRP